MREDTWNPGQYNKFQKERNAPFADLLSLIQKKEKMHVVDLGCGDGILTKKLHTELNAEHTLGIEKSQAMFEKALLQKTNSLDFEKIPIEDFEFKDKYDLIFAHASLHWLKNHKNIFEKSAHGLTKRGQIAFQLPANVDYPTHTVGKEIEVIFAKKFGKDLCHPMHVESLEYYATLLHTLGFEKQCVRMQVYGHVLKNTREVIEWVKGTFLTWYEKQLTQNEYQDFLNVYQEEVLKKLPSCNNFFFPMKRILIWGEI